MWSVDTRKQYWVAFTKLVVLPDDRVKVFVIPNDLNLYYQAGLHNRQKDAAHMVPITNSLPETESARVLKDAYVHIHRDPVQTKYNDTSFSLRCSKTDTEASKMSVVVLAPRTLKELQKERENLMLELP